MAERTNPHANLIIGAQDEATPVFEQVGASAKRMADTVKGASEQAAKSSKQFNEELKGSKNEMQGLSDPAVPAAQTFDKATSSMIRQVQRLNAELEAGGARNAAYFEKMASVKGADMSALAPYLADLKKAEAAQRVATTGLDRMGMSAKQTAAALRQVPMQFTDIVVSLQGGQSAMQVFLQQGGQLKDMFGGVGAAARAMGGYVLGLINPLTVTAAALGTIAVAYNQGSKENDAFVKSIALTGNASGVTVGQLRAYASAIDGVVGTQAQAAEGLAAFVNAGVRGGDELRRYTQTAIEWEKATGQAVSKTAEQFASLQNAPLAAVLKLNEGTNFLTTSVYEQIKSLAEQGRSADASRVAMDALDGAMRSRAQTIQESLGYIERGWNGIKGAAKEAWDAMLNVGRGPTDEQNLAQLRENLARQQDRNSTLGIKEGQATADLKEQIRLLERKITLANDSASAQADEAKKTQSLIEWDREGLKYLSDREKMQRELAKAQDEGVKAGKSQEQIESRLAAIRASYDKKTGGGGRVSSENKELAEQAKLIAELSGLTGSFAKDWDRLSAVYAKGGMSLDQLTQAQADLLAKQPAIKAATEEQAKAQQLLAKADLDAAASREKYITSLATGLDKIQADIAAQEEATARLGLSKQAIADLDAAKLEMLATDLELQAIKAMDRNLDQQTYDALKQQAQAYRELGIAKKGGAAKEAALDMEKANAEAAKKAQEDWERAAEQINSSLTDALLRGFESGKDFAKNLRDTVVNMFKTMVLRPVISAIVNPIAGSVTSALGLSGAQGGGNSIMGGIQTASNLNSLYGAGAQALWGGTAGASAASLGYANIVGMAGGDAIGALAAANGMWAGVATGAQAAAQAAIAANTAMAAGEGVALAAGTNAAAAGAGAGAGGASGALSAIPGWGWALAGVALLGGMLSKKQTLHSGAGAIYSAEQGLQEGASIYNQSTFKMGDVREYNKDGQALASGIAAGLGSTLDGIAKAFGQKAGYEVATAFADDTSKDGAWGALRISKDGKDLLNWEDTRTSRWAPKEFADGEAGQKEYLAAIAKDTRQVLLDMDLPSWADTMLESIGDAANMDQLAATVQQIGAIQTTFVQLGKTMEGFAGLTDKAFEELMRASGGFEALSANAGTYYENFYSEAEKAANVTRDVTAALADVGLQMPTTREGFRALVEQQMALGESGAQAVAALLEVSGAFASVTAASETAAEAAARLADEQAKAAKEAQDAYQKQARAAQEAADVARRAHEDLLEALTKAAKQALEILGNAIDAEKKEQQAGYDAQMVIIDAQRKASTTFVEAQRAWLGVAIGGAQNYAKVMESEAARIRGFFTGMVLQDDPDAPAGASVFSAQAALRAGDTSDAVLRKATDIDPEMFSSWADYAINFFDTKSIVDQYATQAERAASVAASDVALLEQQLTKAEEQYQADLDHYTRLEGIAKDTLEANILRLDGILQAAQDQLAEALGTKLAVMGLGAALGNFAGAVARLSDVTKNPVTTPLSTTAPVLTTYGTADRADAFVAQVTAYNPVISGATSSSTNNQVVNVLREVVAELQALRTTGADTRAAVEKTTALLDQVTGGGNAMLTETA